MKKIYRFYQEKGITEKLRKKLNNNEKKVLKKFEEFNAISNNQQRVRKHTRILLQIRDVIQEPLTQLNRDLIIKFLGVLNSSPQKEWTKNDIKKTLKRFIKFHYKKIEMMELIKSSSLSKAFNFKRINKASLVKEEELEKLLRASSLKWKAILITLYESGCRPQELTLLKWKDLEFDKDDITNITFFSEKTRKVRTIPVKESTLHLRRWKQEYPFIDVNNEDYVFPSQHDREKPSSPHSIGQMIKRLCKKAGIREIYPYLMRHTRITNLKIKKVDPLIIKRYVGHSPESNVTDVVYSHLTDDDVKDIMLETVLNIQELTTEQENDIRILKEKVEKVMKRLKLK